MARFTLVLGGARSGKSRIAEDIAEKTAKKPIYLATAQAFDDEMRARIALHQSRRNQEWQTVEAPFFLAQALDQLQQNDAVILIDCLTVWLGNLMVQGTDCAAACDGLLQALSRQNNDVILVACEVGLGIVPENAMARQFRDDAGRLNQHIAALADEVIFVAAGLPLKLKG